MPRMPLSVRETEAIVLVVFVGIVVLLVLLATGPE